MLFSWIIIIFLRFNLFYSYIVNRNYIDNIDTGIVKINSNVVVSSSVIRNQYIITFHFAFRNDPQIFLGLNTIINCQTHDSYRVQLINSINRVRNKTHYQFTGQSDNRAGSDPNFQIAISYMAVDTSRMKNIFIVGDTRRSIQKNGPGINLTFPSGNLLSPTTIIRCSINCLWNMKIVLPNFYVQCTYNIQSNTILNTNVLTNVDYSGNGNEFYWGVQVLVIRQDPFLNLKHGYFLSGNDPNNWPVLDLNLNVKPQIFLIGLFSFISPDQCLKISLKPNNKQIATQSNFIQANYFYLQMNIPYLKLIVKGYPFDSKVSFTFENYSKKTQHQIVDNSFQLSSTLQFDSFSQNTLLMTSLKSLKTRLLAVEFKVKRGLQQYQTQVAIHISFVQSIRLNTIESVAEIQWTNMWQSTTINLYEVNDSRIIKDKIRSSGSNFLSVNFSKQMVGIPFLITFRSANKLNVSQSQISLPSISRIQSSVASISSSIIIYGIPNLDTSRMNRLIWTSSLNIKNTITKSLQGNNYVKINFNYQSIIQSKDITLSYNHHSTTTSEFKIYFDIKYVTVKSIQSRIGSNVSIITLCNMISTAILSDFKTTNQNISLIQLLNNNNSSQLIVDNNGYTDSFSLIYFSQKYPYQVIINDLKVGHRFNRIEIDEPTHWINITFNNVQETTPLIVFYHPNIHYSTTINNGSEMTMCMQFSSSINVELLTFYYDSDPQTIYRDIIIFQLSNPLLYCIDEFKYQSKGFTIMSSILLSLYWIIFLVSMFFCQKIFAVELLFVLQFAYMTMIPIGIQCPPFNAMSLLQYSFGWNGIDFPIEKTYININYSILGIQSNVVNNINFMIILMVFCPIIFVVMKALGNYSNHYKIKPRLLTYSKTFIFDVLFTILLVNTPNIFLSSVVSFQFYKTSNIYSFAISLFLIFLVFVGIIFWFIFQTSFIQFRQQFNDRQCLGTISIATSTKLRRLYPIIILFQMIILSSILAINNIMNISLYICLGILVFISIVIMILTPYSNNLGNIRLFIHRFFLITICCLQIGLQHLKNQNTSKTNFVYDYPWILLIVLLIIVIVLYLPYLIYRYILWVKSRDLIDIDLYRKQNKKIVKTSYPNKPVHPLSYYPAMQFSTKHPNFMNKIKNKKQLIKKQVNQNQINSNINLPIIQHPQN